jgi:hypothetical protein
MTKLNQKTRADKFTSRQALAQEMSKLVQDEIDLIVKEMLNETKAEKPKVLYVPELAYKAALMIVGDQTAIAVDIVKRFFTGRATAMSSLKEYMNDLSDSLFNRDIPIGISFDLDSSFNSRACLFGTWYNRLTMASIIIYPMPNELSPNLKFVIDPIDLDKDESDEDIAESEKLSHIGRKAHLARLKKYRDASKGSPNTLHK